MPHANIDNGKQTINGKHLKTDFFPLLYSVRFEHKKPEMNKYGIHH